MQWGHVSRAQNREERQAQKELWESENVLNWSELP